MKRILLTFTIIISTILFSYSQYQANNWYFGNHSGVTFNSGNGTSVSASSINMQEGSGAISNSNGELLFYTDGMTVWNKNHQQMPNGFGLAGAPSSGQSGLTIPKPGSNNIYYVFTVDQNARSRGLKYSIVDMSLNEGMGDVTEKNNSLFAPATEKMSAVHHANGVDLWFVAHKWESDEFVAYLVTETGILTSSPIVSKIGTVHEGHVSRSRGYMKISPKGNKLALAIESLNRYELYDFNNLTGKVSNPIIFPNNYTTAYGVEFSSDGKYLYTSERWGNNLYQFDIRSNNLATILASQTILSSYNSKGIQLAPDGKIYVARGGGSLGVISNPTEAGTNCNYEYYGLNVSGGVNEGLPSFASSYFDNVNFTWSEAHCPGTETEFAIINPTGIQSVIWHFEHPSTASEDVSTSFNPTHIYEIGTYEVWLIAQYADKTDTIIKTIEILPPATMDLGEDREICQGERLCLSGGFTNLVWSTGATCNCITPLISGEYWVIGSDEQGCSEIADTVNIIVNPVPEIDFTSTDVTTEGASDGSIDITVTGGTTPYNFDWSNGATTEDIDNLSEGWYSVNLTDDNLCKARKGISIGGPYDCESDSIGWAQLTWMEGEGIHHYDSFKDNEGNVYMVGNFSGSIIISNDTLISTSSSNVFVTKFSNLGDLIWAKSNGETSTTTGFSGAVDKEGSVYVTGTFFGTVFFDDIEITALENSDAFIAKYDRNGNVIWAKSIGGAGDDWGMDITVNNDGEIILVGRYNEIIYFENDSLPSPNWYDTFIIKYNSNGKYVWSTTISTQITGNHDIEINENNEIFLTGYARGTTNFGELIVNDCDDGYLAKLNNLGEFIFVEPIPTVGSIKVKEDNIYISGTFNGTKTFGDTTITSLGYNDILIAKYENTNFKWIKQAGSDTSDYVNDIAIDSLENIYITGSYKNDMYIDDNILTLEAHPDASSFRNSYLIKYNNNGTYIYSDKITTETTSNTYVTAKNVLVDNVGNVLVFGSCRNQPHFGNYTTPEGETGMFIAKYANTKFQATNKILYPNCGADGATIDLSIAGGRSPYNYIWSNGETTEDLIEMPEGVYSVAVTDAHNCIANDTATVETYEPLSVTSEITNVSIAGANDGAINLTVTGGTSPYIFIWSNGKMTEDLTDLAPGEYTVEIIDFAGSCSITSSFTVSEPDTPIQLELSPSFNCSTNEGCIDLTITGGTAPYTILWSNGANTEDICSLTEGWYSVTVSDVDFTSVDSVYLQAETVIETNITATNTCVGTNTGTAVLEISGGTEPFNILWSNGETTQNNINLASGMYYVTVDDAGDCLQTDSIQVFEDTTPVITEIPTGLDNLCRRELYQNTYSTPEVGADTYIWYFEPVEAGTITGDDVIAYVDWNNAFVGTANVKVKGTNHCGEGDFSPTLYISVGDVTESPDLPIGEVDICMNASSNYSTSLISDAENYEWKLIPSEAGVVDISQNIATINFSETYTGSVHLFVRTINACGASNWSDTLDIEIYSPAIANFSYVANHLELSFTNNSTSANSYLWDFGDGQTSTEVNPVHTYANEDSYNVTLTATNDICGNTEYSENITVTNIGVSDNEFSKTFKIYPNPANDYITFEINNTQKENLTIELYNINGQKVISKKYNSGKSKEIINIEDLARGIYTIKISMGFKTSYQKLVFIRK